MKNPGDYIYIASSQTELPVDEQDFNQILSQAPTGGIVYKSYVSVHYVREMLETLRVVCGNSAMRFIDKQIKELS